MNSSSAAPSRAKDRRHAALSRLATVHSAPAPASKVGPRVVLPGGSVVPLADFGGFGGGGGFTGGERSSASRGHIVFPTLDTSREINTANRTEVLRKARWLYNNDPFAKRCADGVSRMIGWMMFQPKTPDGEWNVLAKKVALDIALSPRLFDRAGKFNFFTYQLLLSRRLGIDGDMLNLATLSPTGSTQILAVEAHQVGSHIESKSAPEPLFYDGVRADPQGRHQAYSVLDPRDPRKTKIYRPGEAHLSLRYERAGQNRGMSAFHPVVNGMLDTREIENDMTLGIKTRNLIGFYMAPREGADAGPALKGAGGLQAGLKQYRREVTQGADDADIPADEELLSYEEVFRGGNVGKFDDYEPKVLESAQPHENEMAFLNYRVRRASLGFDIAPELLWDIGQLSTNSQRWLAADAQEMLETRRMETLIPFCNWWWFHTIGAEIASGRLREPKIPKKLQNFVGWWTCDWIPPAKKTIDRGREGKLALDERRAMLRTFDEHYAEYQQDWSSEISQWLDEIVAIKNMAAAKNLSQAETDMIIANLLAPPPGTALATPAKDGSEIDAAAAPEPSDPVESDD